MMNARKQQFKRFEITAKETSFQIMIQIFPFSFEGFYYWH